VDLTHLADGAHHLDCQRLDKSGPSDMPRSSVGSFSLSFSSISLHTLSGRLNYADQCLLREEDLGYQADNGVEGGVVANRFKENLNTCPNYCAFLEWVGGLTQSLRFAVPPFLLGSPLKLQNKRLCRYHSRWRGWPYPR